MRSNARGVASMAYFAKTTIAWSRKSSTRQTRQISSGMSSRLAERVTVLNKLNGCYHDDRALRTSKQTGVHKDSRSNARCPRSSQGSLLSPRLWFSCRACSTEQMSDQTHGRIRDTSWTMWLREIAQVIPQPAKIRTRQLTPKPSDHAQPSE